jgi:hypothetical protein
MPSQVLTKRRVKRRQQQRFVSKNAKRKVRSVRKHRKTAKKVMRGGLFGIEKIYYCIMYDRIPIPIVISGPSRYEILHILPIIITVMVGDDLYFFFNKNMTSEELTIALKTILAIKETDEVILNPPIELPAVSAENVVPKYNGIPIPNIENIKDIGNNWKFDEGDDSPADELLTKLFLAKLEDPFQQHISKRFIKFKKTGMSMFSKFENVIYSGEISDTIPLHEITESLLTKHMFTSPTSNVVTAGFKYLFEKVNKGDVGHKLQLVLHNITYLSTIQLLDKLYENYISTQEHEIELESKKPEQRRNKTEYMEIYKSKVPMQIRVSVDDDIKLSDVDIKPSDLTAKNILNIVNDNTTAKMKHGIAGPITPLPPGWFKPPAPEQVAVTPP